MNVEDANEKLKKTVGGMLIWAIWKVRKNMNADMKWLDNPEVFKVNQLEPHSDHCYYLDYTDMKKEKNPLLQSLNGQWEFAYSKNVMERPVDFYKDTFDTIRIR